MFGSDKNFKLPKRYKVLMASFGGRTSVEFKHAMISAIVSAAKAPASRKDKNQKETEKE